MKGIEKQKSLQARLCVVFAQWLRPFAIVEAIKPSVELASSRYRHLMRAQWLFFFDGRHVQTQPKRQCTYVKRDTTKRERSGVVVAINVRSQTASNVCHVVVTLDFLERVTTSSRCRCKLTEVSLTFGFERQNGCDGQMLCWRHLRS